MKHHHHYGESDELPRLSYTNPNPEDHLTPSFDCSDEDRPSTVLIGIFNLIASIVGGVSSFHPSCVVCVLSEQCQTQ
jgi:hypothetical protein